MLTVLLRRRESSWERKKASWDLIDCLGSYLHPDPSVNSEQYASSVEAGQDLAVATVINNKSL